MNRREKTPSENSIEYKDGQAPLVIDETPIEEDFPELPNQKTVKDNELEQLKAKVTKLEECIQGISSSFLAFCKEISKISENDETHETHTKLKQLVSRVDTYGLEKIAAGAPGFLTMRTNATGLGLVPARDQLYTQK